MKQMHILHIGGSLTQEVDTLFSIRERRVVGTAKFVFLAIFTKVNTNFRFFFFVCENQSSILYFPRNRYLILKYFYSAEKIDSGAEWMTTLFCLTICVPKYFAVIQSGGRRFWFQCQRQIHPCRSQLSWTGHCIGTYLQHWQPKGWLLQMEHLMELD